MLPSSNPLPQAAPPVTPPHPLVQALTQRATVPALMAAAQQRPTPPNPLELVAALHALGQISSQAPASPAYGPEQPGSFGAQDEGAGPAPLAAVPEHPQVGAIRSALLHAFLRGELVRGKGQQF